MSESREMTEIVTLRRRLAGRLDYIGKKLAEEAAILARDMETLRANVEQGRGVNGLGVIQGRGSSVDVLCARYEELREWVSELDTLIETTESP